MNLGPSINSTDLDGHPGISADGQTLFFQSGRPGQYGWLDIWVTRRETTNGPWSEPVNLGPTVNSMYGDVNPFISADGSILYFQSNRSGGIGDWDLWQVSISPILGSYQKNGDTDLSPKSAKSKYGKEVMPANKR